MADVQGQASATSGGSEFNALAFLVQQMLARVNVATLVKVVACSNSGGVSPVGTVDVQPLVNQLDGSGNAVAHVTIYGLPYLRVQGGANAVIIDPQPGDIGIAVFADRDISSVKATKAQANPGSRRRNSMADGLFLGGVLNGAPTQYVQFAPGGINVTDKNANTIVMDSTGVTINGTLFRRDHSVWTDAEITAMSTHTVSGHTHTQPNDSNGDIEKPTNTPQG